MWDNKIYRASFTVETSSFIINWLCGTTRYIEHHSLLKRLPSSSLVMLDNKIYRASFTVETSSFGYSSSRLCWTQDIYPLVMLDNKIYRASFTVETSSFIINWLCWTTRYIEHHSLLKRLPSSSIGYVGQQDI